MAGKRLPSDGKKLKPEGIVPTARDAVIGAGTLPRPPVRHGSMGSDGAGLGFALTPLPAPMTEPVRSPHVRTAARLTIAVVDVALVLGALWLVWQTWDAWQAWRTRVAQVDVAQQVAEDVLNADHPTLGWKHVPGRSQPMPGFGPDVVWTINANGFRGDRDYTPEPPEGVARILAVGDSFTFGNVAAQDTWPAQLEARLEAVEVINMGASAYGIDQMYLWYQEDGVRFTSDLVVLALIDDDLRRATEDRWVSGHGRPLFVLQDDALVLTNVPVPPRIPPGRPLTGSWGFARFLATRIVRGEATDRKPDNQVPYALIEAFGDAVKAQGADLLVVWLPHQRERTHWLREGTEQRCTEAGIPFLDTTPAFEAASEGGAWRTGPWFLPDGHYNPEGNAIVAEAVAAWWQDHR